jgi:group I intron endonuclease
MPYKNKISGIYSITSPRGFVYIGSSKNILSRWSGHRCNLRKGNHHSDNLQNEYYLYKNQLKYEIVETCDEKDFNFREQYHINNCADTLNTAIFIKNVWVTPSTKEKFKKIHNSKEWKEQRSKIALSTTWRWVAVDCNNGQFFKSYAEAAREFNTTASHIKLLCETQKIGKLGVKFKKSNDDWLTEYPKRTGKKHTEKTKQKFREQRKEWVPTKKALDAAIKAISKAVVGINIKTGEIIRFNSQREAGYFFRPNMKSSSATINKVLNGIKKSAYGHFWKYT